MEFITFFKERLDTLAGNKGPVFIIALCLVLVCIFVYLFYIFPEARIGAEQPIPFSHRVHAGVKGIDCRFCHPYVDRSTFPGLPPVEKCLFCHDYIIANHPEIKKEHYYFNTNTPVPWIKENYVPEHVMSNHERHIKKEIECQACHGEVETMDRIVGRRFKMGFCLECHREKNANVGCWLACHN